MPNDWTHVWRTPMEVEVVIRFNWNPGSPASWECPGEPAHPEDITAFIVDADGVAREISLSREERTTIGQDLLAGAGDVG